MPSCGSYVSGSSCRRNPLSQEGFFVSTTWVCESCNSVQTNTNNYCTDCGNKNLELSPPTLKAAVVGFQRINRKRWWIYSLTLWGLFTVAYALAIILVDESFESSNITALIALTILMLVCVVQTNLNARRFHDIGRPSLWMRILSYTSTYSVFGAVAESVLGLWNANSKTAQHHRGVFSFSVVYSFIRLRNTLRLH